MTSPERETFPTKRVLAVVAVVAAVALAVTAAIVLTSRPDPSPTAAPVSTPTGSPSTPAPNECSTIGPAVATWRDLAKIDDVPAAPGPAPSASTDIVKLPAPSPYREDAESALAAETVGEGEAVVIVSFPSAQGVSAQLVLVDTATRETRWSTTLEGVRSPYVVASPFRGGPAGSVTVADPSTRNLVSVDLSDGTERERLTLGEPGYIVGTPPFDGPTGSSVAVADPVIVIVDATGVSALEADELTTRWSIGAGDIAPGGEMSAVTVERAGNVVTIAGRAFEADSGQDLGWSTPLTLRSAAQSTVGFTADLSAVAGVDPRTGEECWRYPASSAVATSDAVFLVTQDGTVEEVDPASGARRTAGVLPEGAELTVVGDTVSAVTYGENPRLVYDAFGPSPVEMSTYAIRPSLGWSDDHVVTHRPEGFGGAIRAYSTADGTQAWEMTPVRDFAVGGGAMFVGYHLVSDEYLISILE